MVASPNDSRVLLRADPEEAAVEQAHRARRHARSRVTGLGLEVLLHVLAQGRQRAREPHHVRELLGVAPGAPVRVVEVLLAAGGVGAGRLQVPARIGADPDVAPRRRDAELAHARQHLGVGHTAPLLVEVLEAAAAPAASDARSRAVRSQQPCHVAHSLPVRRRFRLAGDDAQPRVQDDAERHRRGRRADRRARPVRRGGPRGRARPAGRRARARRPSCSTCAASSSWTRAACAWS